MFVSGMYVLVSNMSGVKEKLQFGRGRRSRTKAAHTYVCVPYFNVLLLKKVSTAAFMFVHCFW